MNNTEPVVAMEFANSQQGLVSKPSRNSGKTIPMLAVVGVLLFGSVLFILMYDRTHPLPSPQAHQVARNMDLENLLDGTFEPNRFNGTWVSDNEILMSNEIGQILLYNVENKSSQILLSNPNIVGKIISYELSSDHKFLLIAQAIHKIYRHSFYAHYSIWDIGSQSSSSVTDEQGNLIPIQLVLWAPKGNAFAYVHSNDIYYRPSAGDSQEYRLTFTGVPSVIYNGICDWVYEEEVFSAASALWFSPDSSKLAFVTFNDTNVDVMSVSYYGQPGLLDTQYARRIDIRYPKPGRRNPDVNAYIVDLSNLSEKKEVIHNALPSGPFSEGIIAPLEWISDNSISVTWFNRIQNLAVVMRCNTLNPQCERILSFKRTNGWIELQNIQPLYSSEGNRMIYIYSHEQKNEDSFNHVTLTHLDSKITVPLTTGIFSVINILAWDQKDQFIYYLGTVEGHPERQQLYRVKDSIEGAPHVSECISCKTENGKCEFSVALFSTENSYYIQTCAGPGVPYITLNNKEGKLISTWETNNRLKRLTENITLPQIKYLKVDTVNGMHAYVKLLLPPNMDTSGNTRYPLLVNVYAGPGSHQITSKFSIAFNTYLCAQKNIIIAYIDGRGSDLKGNKIQFAGYRKLGTVEMEDQLNVTRHLQDTLPYVDKIHTGVWGWSYGGYASGMVLAMDTGNAFRCGISIAPVTDWIYYDTIYTERYMGLPVPNDNYAGYIASSLIRKSRMLANKMYLLVHGNFDDNVHYQQSMMLSRALELLDIQFRQQSYPDEEHSLDGVRHHFYHLLQSFLLDCFEKR